MSKKNLGIKLGFVFRSILDHKNKNDSCIEIYEIDSKNVTQYSTTGT